MGSKTDSVHCDPVPADYLYQEMPHLCQAHFAGFGKVSNAQASAAANLEFPIMTPLWAAGLSFSRCHAERNVPNAKFELCDALDMKYEDNSFDLVWACESGEHMPDKVKYVEEMARVLKPGGRIVVATW